MNEYIMLFLSLAILVGLLYCLFLINDMKKITNKMLKRSKRYMRQLDKSIKEYDDDTC